MAMPDYTSACIVNHQVYACKCVQAHSHVDVGVIVSNEKVNELIVAQADKLSMK